MKQITVAGAGYVGLSLATLLSQNNNVKLVEVIQDKVDMINCRLSPIKDEYIEKFFAEKQLNLKATSDVSAYENAEFIIIAVPTNYNEETHYFDCHFIEDVIDAALPLNPNATFVIKSTIPSGYCNRLYNKYPSIKLMFAPEFLREGRALYDNLYPSRIIVGRPDVLTTEAQDFANMLIESSWADEVPVLYMSLMEAESVKLFANTYLAMRVAYFNELDTYAELKGLNTENIVKGISLDPRIGDYYNNPSFGYGGYCFPKDTKQMLANYTGIPQNLITAIVEANKTRKEHIATQILEKHPYTVGVYRLTMKSGSDNFRQSAIQDIIDILKTYNVNIIVYEPAAKPNSFDYTFENNLEEFKSKSDVILANRYNTELDDVKTKVYTKDIFNNN